MGVSTFPSDNEISWDQVAHESWSQGNDAGMSKRRRRRRVSAGRELRTHAEECPHAAAAASAGSTWNPRSPTLQSCVAPSHPAGISACARDFFFSPPPASAGGRGWQFITILILGVTEWRRFSHSRGEGGGNLPRAQKEKKKLRKGQCVFFARSKKTCT